jgi:hypothetical protein
VIRERRSRPSRFRSSPSCPKSSPLPEAVDTWWHEIDAFLRLDITNALTEGSNRTIKQSNASAVAPPFRPTTKP